MNKPIQAVALVSSGLDSLLAAKIVRDFGVGVVGLHCFFRLDPLRDESKSRIHRLFDPFGIPVRVEDVTEDFLRTLLEPEHGYGRGVNPCIDCKIFMLRRARQILEEIGGGFIVTGEVVGQRPMSQMKPVLFHIEKEAGLRGLILRPLSAHCLPPTVPEEKGWVDRERLYAIQGRSRREQIRLAEQLGIRSFEQPAGGCVLTNPQFADRARVLFRNRDKTTITLGDLQLLRLGRHIWPSPALHVIVGRDERENTFLEAYRGSRWTFEPAVEPGPLVLADGISGEGDIRLVASITARYIGKNMKGQFRIAYQGPGSEKSEITVESLDEQSIEAWRV